MSTYLLLDVLGNVLFDLELGHGLFGYLDGLSLHFFALRSRESRCRIRQMGLYSPCRQTLSALKRVSVSATTGRTSMLGKGTRVGTVELLLFLSRHDDRL